MELAVNQSGFGNVYNSTSLGFFEILLINTLIFLDQN
jgi:hypothetical protein